MDAGLNETRMKVLGELAEMAFVLARDLQQSALNAETHEEKVRLSDAFHRVSRGVRQSLALHAQLERELERAPAQPPAEIVDFDKTRRSLRRGQVRAAVERLIWTEREKLVDPPETLVVRLGGLVASEAAAEDFLAADPDVIIARLCRMLGVPHPEPTPAHPREGGDPSDLAAAEAADIEPSG